MIRPEDTNYMTLETVIEGRKIMFQMKLGDEGIILDIFDISPPNSRESPEVITSTWRFYNEIKTHRITSNPCSECSFYESMLDNLPCQECSSTAIDGTLCYETNHFTTDYLIESACDECGHPHAMVLVHLCDKMHNPEHDTCSDECNPTEDTYTPELHTDDIYDPFLRCAKCGTHNTKDFELS